MGTVSGEVIGIWCDQWQLPFESAYNLLQKYAWANVVRGPELIRTVFCLKHIQSHKRFDILYGHSFVPEKCGLRSKLDISSAVLRRHPSSRWAEMFAWSANVRFCPACLENGYHSYFHQFPAISHCPIHAQPLRNTCSHCNNLTPSTDLTVDSFNPPFACSRCKGLLAGALSPQSWSGRELREQVNAALNPLDQWLRELRSITPLSGDSRYPPLQALGLHSDTLVESSAAAWFELAHRIVPCPLSANFLQLPGRPLYLRHVVSREPVGGRAFRVDYRDAAPAKKRIVKSIRRYIYRRYLHGHEGCLEHACRSLHVERFQYDREIHQSLDVCVLAAGYRRWFLAHRWDGYLALGWGRELEHGLGARNYGLASLVYPEDPDHVHFAMKTLFSFFTDVATSVAFTRLGAQVDRKIMDPNTMDERLSLRCSMTWNDFWSASLPGSDPTLMEFVATSATDCILEAVPACPRHRRKHIRRMVTRYSERIAADQSAMMDFVEKEQEQSH